MTLQVNGARDERPLGFLDVSETEERAYRWLLTHPAATVPEVASVLQLPPRKTQQLLDAIEAKGLVTYSPQRPRRYVPVSPTVAMEALVLKRMEDLTRARVVIQELQEQATRHQGEQEQLVELITSRETERQVFDRMHDSAQQEVVTLIRLPILISRLDVPPEQAQRAHREALARGVRFRNIVDAGFLAEPGMADRILGDMRAGEDIRVVPSLPFKMALADRRIAFIPMSLEQPDSPSLLVRSSALVDALYALFENLWERAVPISLSRRGEFEMGDLGSELQGQSQAMVSLMAAGLPDKVIAQELGISASTLNRRIVEVMGTLDAHTRFQFGWLSALRLSGKS